LLDEYNTQVARLFEVRKDILEPLKKSIRNAMTKYSKTKDPASQASITIMRNLHLGKPISIHPALLDQVDEKEQALLTFKEQLSRFKPKQSVLEVSIEKTHDYARINIFQDTLDLQKTRLEDRKLREANEKQAREVIERITSIEEKKRIEMASRIRENNKILAELAKANKEDPSKIKLSKRAQKKLDKAMSNKNISELEKKLMVDEA